MTKSLSPPAADGDKNSHVSSPLIPSNSPTASSSIPHPGTMWHALPGHGINKYFGGFGVESLNVHPTYLGLNQSYLNYMMNSKVGSLQPSFHQQPTMSPYYSPASYNHIQSLHERLRHNNSSVLPQYLKHQMSGMFEPDVEEPTSSKYGHKWAHQNKRDLSDFKPKENRQT